MTFTSTFKILTPFLLLSLLTLGTESISAHVEQVESMEGEEYAFANSAQVSNKVPIFGIPKTNQDDQASKADDSGTAPSSTESDSPSGEGTSATSSNYDPIKENGEFFTGWDKPELALVLTGLLDGYIEPCGCAGMDRMKGGLSRRANFLKTLRNNGWPVVAIDAGQITNGYGFQEELKLDMAVNALRMMGYQAIGISPNELRFPTNYLLTFTVPPSEKEQSLFVSANIGLYGFLDIYTRPWKVIEQNGKRIGVTSVIEIKEGQQFDDNVQTKPAAEKLKEILPKLQAEKCDHLVLIAHGSEEFVGEIAKQFPEFNVILTGDSPTEPPAEPKVTDQGQYLIEVGEKGKFAIVLGFYSDKVLYQRVALDSRYASSKDVHLLMTEYQDILKGIVTKGGFKGLGLNAVDSPNSPLQGTYVGSQKCESCHEESFRVWKKNRHSSAWKSIATDPPTETSANPPREFDPECVSCHVVGWNGVENFPYISGFTSLEETPHLANVGCESCHGPGSKHIEAEMGDDEQIQDKQRNAMRLGQNARQICFSCHDSDNSPSFDFDTYYKVIEHSEGLSEDGEEEGGEGDEGEGTETLTETL